MVLFLSAIAYLAISTIAVLVLDVVIARFYGARPRATASGPVLNPFLIPFLTLKSIVARMRL